MIEYMALLISKLDVSKETGCWGWTGAINTYGYGHLYAGGRSRYAHRLSYELFRGTIPVMFQIDHLCRNRLCANPSHLEAVTCRENLLRGETLAAKNAAKTHCKRGHALVGDNLYLAHRKGAARPERHCKRCKRDVYIRMRDTDPEYHARTRKASRNYRERRAVASNV